MRTQALRRDVTLCMTTLTGPNETLAHLDAAQHLPVLEAPLPRTVRVGELCVESAVHNATFRGLPLGLTSIECAILEYLARAAGRLVTRDELSLHLHQRPYRRVERAIDMHVSHLRKKLEPASGLIIRTIRGAGYQLVAVEGATDAGPSRS